MSDRRSAKGEMVDFDLYRAKQEIGATPPPNRVQQRQAVIDKRLRRKINTVGGVAPVIKNPVNPKQGPITGPTVESHVVDVPVPPAVNTPVSPTQPAVVEKVEKAEGDDIEITATDIQQASSDESEVEVEVRGDDEPKKTTRRRRRTKPQIKEEESNESETD